MRIMAVSDLHGELAGIDPTGADVVVIAGDVAPLRGRTPWHLREQAAWVNEEFREWTSSFPGVAFVVVPGNHDFFALRPPAPGGHGRGGADNADDEWLGYGFSANVRFLVGAGAEVAGLRFFGTPWVPVISGAWAFEAGHDELTAEFAKIPAGLDVLITHSPPRVPGSDIDRSLQTNSPHFGSPELTNAILAKRPRLAFCGHVHSGAHGAVAYEGMRLFNVSRLDERYAIAYPPTVVEV